MMRKLAALYFPLYAGLLVTGPRVRHGAVHGELPRQLADLRREPDARSRWPFSPRVRPGAARPPGVHTPPPADPRGPGRPARGAALGRDGAPLAARRDRRDGRRQRRRSTDGQRGARARAPVCPGATSRGSATSRGWRWPPCSPASSPPACGSSWTGPARSSCSPPAARPSRPPTRRRSWALGITDAGRARGDPPARARALAPEPFRRPPRRRPAGRRGSSRARGARAMRIAIVAPSLEIVGGQSIQAHALCAGLRQDGHEVDVRADQPALSARASAGSGAGRTRGRA